MIPVSVASVSFVDSGFIVFLREESTERTLPIMVGLLEARSIAGQLAQEHSPRPMTHDLLKNVIEVLQCRLIRIEVCDLVDNTFYGKLVLDNNGTILEIDSRPSDAIALALRFSSPIFVAEKVMEEAGIIIEEQQEPEEDVAEEPSEQISDVDRLKQRLDEAISRERYEEAAQLRDEIARLTRSTESN